MEGVSTGRRLHTHHVHLVLQDCNIQAIRFLWCVIFLARFRYQKRSRCIQKNSTSGLLDVIAAPGILQESYSSDFMQLVAEFSLLAPTPQALHGRVFGFVTSAHRADLECSVGLKHQARVRNRSSTKPLYDDDCTPQPSQLAGQPLSYSVYLIQETPHNPL